MNRHQIGFASVASLISMTFLGVVNYLTSWNIIWFIYPSFFILLWLMSLILIPKKNYKSYALFCSLMIIGILIATNYLYSPSHPWFLYACYPIIWWPIVLFSGKSAKTLTFSLTTSILTILYYFVLNTTLSPQYLWVIYPAYAILWWPISLFFVQKKNYFGLSLAGSFLSLLFFTSANLISTPQTIWAIYPIFLILWWPLSMYFYVYLKRKNKRKTNP